jgi:hypothetical protein
VTEKSSQTPLPSPGWIFLARGVQESDTIARCPGGHIHLDYGNLTVRFQRAEFLAFARMVAEAAMRLQGISPNVVDHRVVSKLSVAFSLN